jgi:hypothetical protein
MAAAYLFYRGMESGLGVADKQVQVYDLHFLLLAAEAATILLLFKAFAPRR